MQKSLTEIQQRLLTQLRQRAWIAAGLMGALAAACASMHLAFPTAAAAMAAGVIIMWKSEEEQAPAAAAAPEEAPAPRPAFRPAA